MINIIKNKKIFYDYFIIATYNAGIVLYGSEIKSIRNYNVTINDAYCYIINNTIYVRNIFIAQYQKTSLIDYHDVTRDRILLLKRREISSIKSKISNLKLTIVPLMLFINNNNYAKLQIGIVKGKKLYDKRNIIKERDIKKSLQYK